MDDSTALEIERAKTSRKSPVLLWVLNVFWPGLGNLVVGQLFAGIVFGFLHLLLVILAVATLGIFGILCFLNWLVASVVGHRWINARYMKSLEAIESKHADTRGTV